jgi:hypothetical protein
LAALCLDSGFHYRKSNNKPFYFEIGKHHLSFSPPQIYVKKISFKWNFMTSRWMTK